MDNKLTKKSLSRPRWLARAGAIAAFATSACGTDSSAGNGAYAAAGGGPSTGGASLMTGATGGSAGSGTNDAGAATLAVVETPLVADDGSAPTKDPNLLNAWGLAINPDAPGGPFFWVSANHSGLATVYDAAGKVAPLVVNVTPGDGGAPTAEPTGQVFNATTGFMGDKFIFDGEDGKVSGWQSGTTAVVRADESASGAIYKGLAIVGSTLWAANFHAGTIDVFDAKYAKTATSPADSTIPSGYAPFNVADIDGKVYVAYAMQDSAAQDDSPGAGHGYVDVFRESGQFDRRLVSAGALNSPWGIAKAPATFGAFAGALLIGNFGDGAIHAFDAASGALLGSFVKRSGLPLAIAGLWDLKFGPKTASVDLTSTLFFTAGPGGEAHGLFGKLELAP